MEVGFESEAELVAEQIVVERLPAGVPLGFHWATGNSLLVFPTPSLVQRTVGDQATELRRLLQHVQRLIQAAGPRGLFGAELNEACSQLTRACRSLLRAVSGDSSVRQPLEAAIAAVRQLPRHFSVKREAVCVDGRLAGADTVGPAVDAALLDALDAVTRGVPACLPALNSLSVWSVLSVLKSVCRALCLPL
eukprot:TRINITY_DN228_c0_g3_i2.p1 TRINITY_DN228_c0_g3~~TRINITY_DN228_c0_g3_i2.p1  ORF type:complete len:192 (-),score=51.09 TRINITY_DN228_c0_g3_i2:390-965(-)